MWAQYANNFSGICLVYNFMMFWEAVKQSEGMSIMPVRYIDNRDQCKDIRLNLRIYWKLINLNLNRNIS